MTQQAYTLGKLTRNNINYQAIYTDLLQATSYASALEVQKQAYCQFKNIDTSYSVVCDCNGGKIAGKSEANSITGEEYECWSEVISPTPLDSAINVTFNTTHSVIKIYFPEAPGTLVSFAPALPTDGNILPLLFLINERPLCRSYYNKSSWDI